MRISPPGRTTRAASPSRCFLHRLRHVVQGHPKSHHVGTVVCQRDLGDVVLVCEVQSLTDEDVRVVSVVDPGDLLDIGVDPQQVVSEPIFVVAHVDHVAACLVEAVDSVAAVPGASLSLVSIAP